MPATTVLSRVKSDFFAILIPGFFVLVIITSGFLAFTHDNPSISIIKRIDPFFTVLKDYWPLVFVIFIIAYLMGMLLHTIRVNIADEICGIFFARLYRREWSKLGYKCSFPYIDALEAVKDDLVHSNLVSDFKIPDKKYLYNAYNYWRIVINLESKYGVRYFICTIGSSSMLPPAATTRRVDPFVEP